jgi:hypothetical protein
MEVGADVFRPIIHYSFHLLVPFIFAKLFWNKNWWKAGLIKGSEMVFIQIVKTIYIFFFHGIVLSNFYKAEQIKELYTILHFFSDA